jgi:pimeloyl-ACP methyl ester carboxylesterase
VLAVHGMLHAGTAWRPLTEALLRPAPWRREPCRVIALDLPGHGEGRQPSGALFGEMVFDDYVTWVRATLDRLRAMGIRPATIVGHSLGGAMIQLVQQRLATEGTNLRREYGVRDVVLLGSAIPEPIPVPGGNIAPLLAFITFSPELGWHVSLPPAVWRAFLFGNLAGQLGGGAPSVEDVVAHGYAAPESMALLQGLAVRPTVDAGLFDESSHTRLTLVAYEQDPIVRVESSQALYVHLTSDTSLNRFSVIGGPASVHDMHISAPDILLQGLGPLARAF